MLNMVDFSVRLKCLRQEKHLTQAQVAQIVGISRSMVSQYETDIKDPSFDVLRRFAGLYGCTLEYLLNYEGRRMVDIDDLTDAQAAAIVEIINQFRQSNLMANAVVAGFREVI